MKDELLELLRELSLFGIYKYFKIRLNWRIQLDEIEDSRNKGIKNILNVQQLYHTVQSHALGTGQGNER